MTPRTEVPTPAEVPGSVLSPDIDDDARYAWRMIFIFAHTEPGQILDPLSGETALLNLRLQA